jgi:NAD(P)H dehydrogenase (quinone)
MSDPVPARLLYPGSGGHLGRRVVKLLMEAGDSNITASNRSPQKLSRFAAKVKQISTIQPRSPRLLPESSAC